VVSTARIGSLTRDVQDRRDERDGPNGEGLVDFQLCASNEGSLRPRVERAQRPYELPRHPLLIVRVLRVRRAPGLSSLIIPATAPLPLTAGRSAKIVIIRPLRYSAGTP
jgi:hypothetical protein